MLSKENQYVLKCYVENLLLCEDFDKYSFINLSKIGLRVTDKHPGC